MIYSRTQGPSGSGEPICLVYSEASALPTESKTIGRNLAMPPGPMRSSPTSTLHCGWVSGLGGPVEGDGRGSDCTALLRKLSFKSVLQVDNDTWSRGIFPFSLHELHPGLVECLRRHWRQPPTVGSPPGGFHCDIPQPPTLDGNDSMSLRPVVPELYDGPVRCEWIPLPHLDHCCGPQSTITLCLRLF